MRNSAGNGARLGFACAVLVLAAGPAAAQPDSHFEPVGPPAAAEAPPSPPPPPPAPPPPPPPPPPAPAPPGPPADAEPEEASTPSGHFEPVDPDGPNR